MKKTLIIIHPHFTIPGGAGKVVLELGKRISKKMNVVIIAQQINQEYIDAYPEIKFENLNGPITSSLKFWLLLPLWQNKTFKIIKHYHSKGEVVVLCNVFPANWIGLPLQKKIPQIKFLWYCHEPSAFIHIKKWRDAIQNPIMRMLAILLCPVLALIDKNITNNAGLIFSNSEFTSANIKDVYNRNSIVIYPGIDSNDFMPIPYEKKGNYILTVSRLSKFKNIDMLIKALMMLRNKDIKLKIVGDGEEKIELINFARKLKISDRVKIMSGLSDNEVAKVYAKAKIFVLCSKNEPFGMAPVEALASGAMVIADNSGGPKEVVDNGNNGVLIENMSEYNLADCINDLLKDDNKILRLSTSPLNNKIRKEFSWDNAASKILIYL